jgi:hypothetical protein
MLPEIGLSQAMEIFKNQNDIQIFILNGKPDYVFEITRGPLGEFSPITKPLALSGNLDEAVGTIMEILESARQLIKGSLKNPDSIASLLVEAQEIDNFLPPKLIELIGNSLLKETKACTYKMLAKAS